MFGLLMMSLSSVCLNASIQTDSLRSDTIIAPLYVNIENNILIAFSIPQVVEIDSMYHELHQSAKRVDDLELLLVKSEEIKDEAMMNNEFCERNLKRAHDALSIERAKNTEKNIQIGIMEAKVQLTEQYKADRWKWGLKGLGIGVGAGLLLSLLL